MKKTVCAFTLLALSGLLHAEQLIVTWKSADSGVTHSLDIDNIDRNGDLVEMWRVIDYKAPYLRYVNQKPYTSQRVHTEFDCESMALRQLSYSWHEEAGGKGELLSEIKEADQWEFGNQDEFITPLWKIACPRQK
jgi:hypothetical protein